MSGHSAQGSTQAQRADAFRQLHTAGSPLILANVWDAASAHMVAAAGGKAVATSSGAVSWAHGVPDGSNLDLGTVCASLREIVSAAGAVPVTADIEGGYAESPEGVAASVCAVLETGIVGINIEDSGAPAESTAAPLYTAADHASPQHARQPGARVSGCSSTCAPTSTCSVSAPTRAATMTSLPGRRPTVPPEPTACSCPASLTSAC